MNILVFMENNEIFTTSQAIAEGVQHNHSTVLKLIRKSMDLDQLRDLKSKSLKTKGRAAEVFYLTEEQATLIITLMKNTPVVRNFKSSLVKAFFKQRKLLQKLLSQKDNAEWLEKREKTKNVRLEETDVIKKFVNYATEQGSKNAHRYYANISKMENNALFLIEQKFENLRDIMDFKQLALIQVADEAVKIALENSMNLGLPYKECYQKAKEKIEALAKIFPPSPLPSLLNIDTR